MTPAETLAKSKQLDGFLGRAVREIKTMNRFAELASKVRANQEAMNAEADDLSTEADKTMSLFMASAGRYRTMLDEAKAGIKAMEEAALAMAGGNGGPLLDSQGSSSSIEEALKPLPVILEPAVEPPVPGYLIENAPLPPALVDPTANGNAA